LALVLATTVFLAACASAPERSGPVSKNDYQHMTRSLDWLLQTEMKRASVPGVSVVVVNEQGVVWSKGYGVSGVGAATAVSINTRFRVGSVSKLLTATETLRRADRGEINLDAPLAAQLPGFAVKSRFNDAPPITARALLSHHAGLPTSQLRGMWEARPDDLMRIQALLREQPLLMPPQTYYNYSNLGYTLLGRLIEHKSGQAFSAAMQEHLLQPLGMSQASFERNAEMPGAIATGHRKGQALAPFGLRDEPAGALVASAADMSLFLRFALGDGRPLLRAKAIDAMFEPQFPGLPLDFGHRIGMGWMLSGLDSPGAGPLAWHAGQYPGYAASVAVSRRHGLAAVVLANGEEASSFVTEVAAKAIELALEAKSGEAAKQQPLIQAAKRSDVKEAELAADAGDYAVFGAKSKIAAKGNRLSAELFDNKLDLVPLVDGRFALQKGVLGLLDVTLPDMTLRFATVEGRRFAVLDGLRAPVAFERIEKRPVSQPWRARLGRYTSAGADNALEFLSFELAIEDGVLVAQVKSNSRLTGRDNAQGSVVLETVSDDTATVVGGGAMEGGALQATRRNGRDVLSYSGYELTRSDN
jgi:CubicO group peptidase (beta-lactamase class C family)